MYGTTAPDRILKIVILAFLILSVLTQILVSAWFYDKLKVLESHLSVYPVNKPVDVDLRITIPELVEIDRKIDRLTQLLGRVPATPRKPAVASESTKTDRLSRSVRKKASPRGSTQVDVVEKIGN